MKLTLHLSIQHSTQVRAREIRKQMEIDRLQLGNIAVTAELGVTRVSAYSLVISMMR